MKQKGSGGPSATFESSIAVFFLIKIQIIYRNAFLFGINGNISGTNKFVVTYILDFHSSHVLRWSIDVRVPWVFSVSSCISHSASNPQLPVKIRLISFLTNSVNNIYIYNTITFQFGSSSLVELNKRCIEKQRLFQFAVCKAMYDTFT